MLTQNYYNLIANMVASGGYEYGPSTIGADAQNPGLIWIDVFGVPHSQGYCFGGSFPYLVDASLRLSNTNINDPGIVIGTDGTTPTIRDTQLGSMITSGVSMSLASTKHGCDAPGIPYVEYKISVTNTGSDPITIREIGYRQKMCYENSSSASSRTYLVLLDRTVLTEPLTIQAGDSGIIDYKIQTVPVERTKNGIRLVSWTYGSDEDVAAMIDAAQQGLIDLQEDAGWRVGEFRTIHVNAWTGGGSVSHAAVDIKIAISQFGDYNECGSVLQFDFFELFPEKQRMAASSTNVGGYSATEMYTTTLPALVEALPSWLKTRLKTFSVVVTKGNQSTTLETIGNNKLALRSASEVRATPNASYFAVSEGSEVQFYRATPDSASGGTRYKYKAGTASMEGWLLRSPATNSTSYFGYINYSGTDSTSTPSSASYYLAPFGCI